MNNLININKPIQDKVLKFFRDNFKENDMEEYNINYVKKLMLEYLGVNKGGI